MEIGVELGKEPKSIGGRECGNEEKKTPSAPSLPTLMGSVPSITVECREELLRRVPTDPDGGQYRGSPCR